MNSVLGIFAAFCGKIFHCVFCPVFHPMVGYTSFSKFAKFGENRVFEEKIDVSNTAYAVLHTLFVISVNNIFCVSFYKAGNTLEHK